MRFLLIWHEARPPRTLGPCTATPLPNLALPVSKIRITAVKEKEQTERQTRFTRIHHRRSQSNRPDCKLWHETLFVFAI